MKQAAATAPALTDAADGKGGPVHVGSVVAQRLCRLQVAAGRGQVHSGAQGARLVGGLPGCLVQRHPSMLATSLYVRAAAGCRLRAHLNRDCR